MSLVNPGLLQYGKPNMEPMRRVAILGGTFNPVHNGHMDMARHALNAFPIEKVLFIPTGNPPHKTDVKIASAKDRLNMLRLAAAEDERMEVSSLEIDRQGMTYTVDTLTELCRENPDVRYEYLIGADTLFALPTWRNFERVAQLCSFLVFMRGDSDRKTLYAEGKRLLETYMANIEFTDLPCMDVSSTQIRERVEQGGSVFGLVPDKVGQYILKNGVYRVQ